MKSAVTGILCFQKFYSRGGINVHSCRQYIFKICFVAVLGIFRESIIKYISNILWLQKMLPAMCLYRCMYMPDLVHKCTWHSVRDVTDMKCIIGAELLLAHTSTLHYAISRTLCLKWKPHHIESCFPMFITRVDT